MRRISSSGIGLKAVSSIFCLFVFIMMWVGSSGVFLNAVSSIFCLIVALLITPIPESIFQINFPFCLLYLR